MWTDNFKPPKGSDINKMEIFIAEVAVFFICMGIISASLVVYLYIIKPLQENRNGAVKDK